jgi:hypothetical protein
MLVAHKRIIAVETRRTSGSTAGRGSDVVIKAIGLPAAFCNAVEEVARAGRVVYIGYAKERAAYETRLFVQKELASWDRATLDPKLPAGNPYAGDIVFRRRRLSVRSCRWSRLRSYNRHGAIARSALPKS